MNILYAVNILQIILTFRIRQRLYDFTFPRAGHEKLIKTLKKKSQSLPLLSF
jgi:hypothetical protein